VAADTLARFARLDGKDVYFVTGTDEHGQKVEEAARGAGLDPQSFCDRISEQFREMGRVMNISNDDFIRTTEARHIQACNALWKALANRGDIYLGEFKGWYSVRDEAFYDQSELIDGMAPNGAPVEWVTEPNYFFRLSAYSERLLRLFEMNPEFIQPASRRNEIMSFVKSGLRDLSISRSNIRWGIHVPGDNSHVMYVWLDALTNYISVLGYPDLTDERWQKFWPADVHLVGKDITRFHTIYWPAFLMAAGIDPPRSVFAHGWWTVEGKKMSKSLKNFIPPQELAERYGVDALRYFMLRELSFGSDGDFSHHAIVSRVNSDLANGIGNLAHRVLTLIARRCGCVVPHPSEFSPKDDELLSQARTLLAQVRREIEALAIHRALGAIWALVADTNRYIDMQAPWSLSEAHPARFATVLYVLVESIRQLAVLIQPFMPNAAASLLNQLAVPTHQRSFAHLNVPISPGRVLPPPVGLFLRHEHRAFRPPEPSSVGQ
jgi:methionyl-tRNA synthetase